MKTHIINIEFYNNSDINTRIKYIYKLMNKYNYVCLAGNTFLIKSNESDDEIFDYFCHILISGDSLFVSTISGKVVMGGNLIEAQKWINENI